MTRLETLPASARPADVTRPQGIQSPEGAVAPVARIDWRGRRASCATAECGRTLTRLVRIGQGSVLRPIFTGEWHEGDDHVWRLTPYARVVRQRGPNTAPTGRSLGLTRRRALVRPDDLAAGRGRNSLQRGVLDLRLTQTIRRG